MAREHTVVRTANFIKILLDGQSVGIVQNMRGSDDYGLEPVHGVGNINAFEHVPTVARHNVSVGLVVLRRDLLVQKGFIPKNGKDALRGLIFDMEAYDERDGQMIKGYIGCSYASGDVSIDANRVIMRNTTFMALDTIGLV